MKKLPLAGRWRAGGKTTREGDKEGDKNPGEGQGGLGNSLR